MSLTKDDMMEKARAAAGVGPHWNHKSAEVTIRLADGTVYVYRDVSLIGVSLVVNALGTP